MRFLPAQAKWSLAIVLFLSLTPPVRTQDKHLAQAEQLYAQRPDLSRVRRAISLLNEVVKNDPENYEAFRRLAKYYHFLGDHVKDEDEKKDVFEKGIGAGKRAVALQPHKADGHFWLAANYGSSAEYRSFLTRWRIVKPMREELEAAIRIDPRHENGSAYALLGKLYAEAPGLFGGDLKRGIEYGEKAVEIGPDNSLAKLFLAESYFRAGRKSEAKRLLEEILAMSPDKGYEFEFTENQQEARRLLKEKFK